METESRILERAARCGLDLSADRARFLAFHAERVLAEAEALQLTAIRDRAELLERHVGESLEGAALIPRGTSGAALDLGSGNGYPGIPIAAVHEGLRVHLADVSAKKAAFLRTIADRGAGNLVVLERQIQRAADLADLPEIEIVCCRAMGGWERVLPKLVGRIVPGGRVLLWAGEAGAEVAARTAWRSLRLGDRKPLPGRDRSWIFVYYKLQDVV